MLFLSERCKQLFEQTNELQVALIFLPLCATLFYLFIFLVIYDNLTLFYLFRAGKFCGQRLLPELFAADANVARRKRKPEIARTTTSNGDGNRDTSRHVVVW